MLTSTWLFKRVHHHLLGESINRNMRRGILWQLLEALRDQCEMPWIVFSDFNEIVYSYEKSGGLERDGKHMANFRDCLDKCGLFDLGYVGQCFAWCNEWHGEQRTKLKLDRMVANED